MNRRPMKPDNTRIFGSSLAISKISPASIGRKARSAPNRHFHSKVISSDVTPIHYFLGCFHSHENGNPDMIGNRKRQDVWTAPLAPYSLFVGLTPGCPCCLNCRFWIIGLYIQTCFGTIIHNENALSSWPSRARAHAVRKAISGELE